jgi:lactate/malate dehydrogenase, NAD binding domain
MFIVYFRWNWPACITVTQDESNHHQGTISHPILSIFNILKQPLQLSLFDIVNTPGVAADLSHISTPALVTGYLPPDDGLKKTLEGADIVVIPAGVPRKPGVSPVTSSFHISLIHDSR